MILFHGTTEIIEKPNVSFSKSYLDFGKGFYLTTYQKQAENREINPKLSNCEKQGYYYNSEFCGGVKWKEKRES